MNIHEQYRRDYDVLKGFRIVGVEVEVEDEEEQIHQLVLVIKRGDIQLKLRPFQSQMGGPGYLSVEPG